MKWALDKIENNIALLENIETGEKKEVSTYILPSTIKEGAILFETNNTYQLDTSEEEKRKKEISERFKRLRSND